jgi:exonuclease III
MNHIPNITIVAANVQRLTDCRKRLNLLTTYAGRTNVDIFLLSETGCKTPAQALQWNQEAHDAGFESTFSALNHTALLWRASSHILSLDTSHYGINSITSSLANPTRSSDATFTVGDTLVTFMAVYSPVIASERKRYLQEMQAGLENVSEDRSLLIGGDWNVVENPHQDSSNPAGPNDGVHQLNQLLDAHSLVDPFRQLYPSKCLFTNQGTNGANRRLDRFYLSPSLSPLVKRHSTWMAAGSTHNPILLSLFLPGAVEKGPGKFKLGLHVINSEGIPEHLAKRTADIFSASRTAYPDNPLQAWKHTKAVLIVELSQLSRKLAKFRRSTGTSQKEELLHYGSAIRARLDPTLSGPTSVQTRLRQVRVADLIPALKIEDGTTVTSTNEILSEAKRFYSKLYQPKASNPAARRELFEAYSRKVPAKCAAGLESDYSLEELGAALRKCQRNCSPGPDGLPFEFYSATWETTGPILIELINYIPAVDTSSLPPREAHIHVHHKKGDHADMNNKRPISLLNTDDRLFSQAHNSRLAPILHHIVNKTQTGFILKRWIGDNIAQIQSVMDHHERDPGLLASIDFEKAYDRVSHEYLEALLEHLGFGGKARRWFIATFRKQTAQVFINGWLSTAFEILSCVRQGDPLAPSLFTIAIESFASLIRQRCIGIKVTGNVLPAFRECLFADDTYTGLKDFNDAAQLDGAILAYGQASGQVVNHTKSFLYLLGTFRHDTSIGTSWNTWTIRREEFRCLGVQVGTTVDTGREWSNMQAGVLARLRGILMYDLPLAARCAIVNRYCYTKILYLDQFSPATSATIHTIVEAAKRAIWGKNRSTVSYARLCTPLDRGGFGLVDLPLQLKGPRAKWIFRILPRKSWDERQYRAARIWAIQDSLQHQTISTRDPYLPSAGYLTWNWVALFCLPTIAFPDNYWLMVTSRVRNLLPPRWQSYLDAWEDYVDLAPALLVRDHWHQEILKPYWKANQHASIPLDWFVGPDGATLSLQSFTKTTSLLTNATYPLTVPQKWGERFHLPSARWARWWEFLRKIRRINSDAEHTAHLLSLGSLHTGAHLGGSTKGGLFPNNLSKLCKLCDGEEETVEHLLIHCPFGQAIWKRAAPSLPIPSLQDFVCPQPKKRNNDQVTLQVLLIHSVYTLSHKRRFSFSPLLPILSDNDTINLVGAKLKEDWRKFGSI